LVSAKNAEKGSPLRTASRSSATLVARRRKIEAVPSRSGLEEAAADAVWFAIWQC
jgi:hypothetical protein